MANSEQLHYDNRADRADAEWDWVDSAEQPSAGYELPQPETPVEHYQDRVWAEWTGEIPRQPRSEALRQHAEDLRRSSEGIWGEADALPVPREEYRQNYLQATKPHEAKTSTNERDQSVETVESQQSELQPSDTLIMPRGFSGKVLQEKVRDTDSSIKTVSVVAKVGFGGKTILISPEDQRDTGGAEAPRFVVHEVVKSADGTEVEVADTRVILGDRQNTLAKSADGSSLLIEPHGENHEGLALYNYSDESATVTVAETTELQEDRKRSRKERRGRFYRKAASVAFAATLTVPAAVEAQNTVEALTNSLNARNVVINTTEEYSIERAEQLAQTMEDLQTGNLEAVRQRAETYRQKNIDQLPSKELILKTREAIDHAKTHEQVAAALQSFMNFYGKKVDFLSDEEAKSLSFGDMTIKSFDAQHTAVKDTKRVAQNTVSALDFLPKRLLQTAGFKRYLINNSSHAAGVQSTDAVVVSTESTLGHESNNFVGKVSGNQSGEWIVLHEIGHSFQHGYFDDITFNDKRSEGFVNDAKKSINHMTKTYLLQSPEAPSGYSGTSGKEKDAEIFAGTLTPNSADWQGLADPKDGASWFTSKSNAYMMKKLVDLDNGSNLSTNDASFADWLMANKKHLVERY